MAPALTAEQVFDSIAIRVDGLRAAAISVTIDWSITDIAQTYRMTLSNGALIHRPTAGVPDGSADLTLTLTKLQLLGLLSGQGLDGITIDGDPAALQRLLGVLDNADAEFAIVTP
jgi:alkyl sulfatase BDS1-like metallo-beta-lactamase superfamily hydrolase